MSVYMNIHNVVSISLATRSRLFGKTDDLEALPKAPNFEDCDNPDD